jgi:hypothetical protein
MQNQTIKRSATVAAATALGAAVARADEKSAFKKTSVDTPALEKSFEALMSFDWGEDHPKYREMLGAIDDAVPATHGNAAARKELENRLSAFLATGASRAAKDYVGRKLAIIGTAESVSALAALLPDRSLSHMARYALERIPDAEAAKALRDSLSTTSGAEKAGVIGSLGVRRDAASVSELAALVSDSSASIALAAATALGDIGTLDSAKALHEAKPASEAVTRRVADARLSVGERLLADGDKAGALAVYESLIASKPAKYILLAATRGKLKARGS